MNKNFKIGLFQVMVILFFFSGKGFIQGQVVRLEPNNPSLVEQVKIIFNAAEGNQALMDLDGDVYIHTGLITDKSNDIHSWKHVIGEWGQDVASLKMDPMGNNLYYFELVIKDFYGVRDEEDVQQIALVFRNVDGTKVGKTKSEEDIVIPVNDYVPPAKKVDSCLFESRDYISHNLFSNRLEVVTNHGLIKLIPYTDDILQIIHLSENEICADSSVAVILPPVKIDIQVEALDSLLIFSAGNFRVRINKSPVQLSIFDHDGKPLLAEEKGYYEKEGGKGCRFKIKEQELFFGLGERAVNFSLNGRKYQLYNKPFYGYEIGALNLNYAVPLLLSSEKYLLFYDNPQKGTVDLGVEKADVLQIENIGGTANYFIVQGEDFNEITANYFTLTGHQSIPPRWAFGNMMSRMAYRTQEETDSIVNLMLENHFPVDAVILDFYWFGDSIKGTMGRLDWYQPNWPDPQKMINDFKDKGINTILITEPYVLDSLDNFKELDEKGLLAKNDLGQSYIDYGFYFGNGGLIDIFKPEAGDWFWEKYKKQIEMGVAAWWGDLGEPESHPWDMIHVNGTADEVHNIYGHYWHHMLFEKYRKEYPQTRLFNLNRAGYAGSQRYSIFPWTGDVARSWGGFRAQLPLMLHMSISGLPYIHADAGGFAQGVLDEELYVRWLQFACFSPVLRPHGSGIPSEPVFYSDTVQDIVRKYMNYRYALNPYLYTSAWKTATKGALMVKPVFFEDESFVDHPEQQAYFLGDDLLVYPVMEKGQKEVLCNFPKGRWYDLFDDSFYNVVTASIKTPLDIMPVFVRSGSFIPTVLPPKNMADYKSDLLIMNYYGDSLISKSDYSMYEDDGVTNLSWEKGLYELTDFTFERRNKLHVFHTERNQGNYEGKPAERFILFRYIGFNQKVQEVFINKMIVQQYESLKDLGDAKQGYFYDAGGVLNIYAYWNKTPLNIEILSE